MRRCRHVNRRGDCAKKEIPRADVIRRDRLPGCYGDSQQDAPGRFTQGNNTDPEVNVRAGIGSGNQGSQSSLDYVLAAKLEALASQVVEFFGPFIREAVENIINNGSASPGKSSVSAPYSSPPATTKVVLSAGARSLLKTIANVANSIEAQDDPRAAWISFTPWFEITEDAERHRADAKSLILELTNAGFVEVYPRPKRNKYKVTVAGQRHLKSLNRG